MVSPKKYKGNQAANKMVCRICLGHHPLRFCPKFRQVDYDEKMRLVSIYKYCAGCLSHDHIWRTCQSKGSCKRCGDMHHTLLHKPGLRPRSSSLKKVKRLQRGPSSSSRPKSSGPRSSQNSARGPRSSSDLESERPSTSRALVPCISKNDKMQRKSKKRVSERTNTSIPVYQLNEMVVIRPTAIIQIVSGDKYVTQRVLIDPGAECSIVSEEVVRILRAKTVRVGNKERCLMTIRGNHGASATVETHAEVRRKHNVMVPSKTVDARIAEEFPGLQMADPLFYVAAPVQITLGVDVYPRIIRNGVVGGVFGKPLAQFSIFGYIISGSCAP